MQHCNTWSSYHLRVYCAVHTTTSVYSMLKWVCTAVSPSNKLWQKGCKLYSYQNEQQRVRISLLFHPCVVCLHCQHRYCHSFLCCRSADLGGMSMVCALNATLQRIVHLSIHFQKMIKSSQSSTHLVKMVSSWYVNGAWRFCISVDPCMLSHAVLNLHSYRGTRQ